MACPRPAPPRRCGPTRARSGNPRSPARARSGGPAPSRPSGRGGSRRSPRERRGSSWKDTEHDRHTHHDHVPSTAAQPSPSVGVTAYVTTPGRAPAERLGRAELAVREVGCSVSRRLGASPDRAERAVGGSTPQAARSHPVSLGTAIHAVRPGRGQGLAPLSWVQRGQPQHRPPANFLPSPASTGCGRQRG
jgi:hypothetical protein